MRGIYQHHPHSEETRKKIRISCIQAAIRQGLTLRPEKVRLKRRLYLRAYRERKKTVDAPNGLDGSQGA